MQVPWKFAQFLVWIGHQKLHFFIEDASVIYFICYVVRKSTSVKSTTIEPEVMVNRFKLILRNHREIKNSEFDIPIRVGLPVVIC